MRRPDLGGWCACLVVTAACGASTSRTGPDGPLADATITNQPGQPGVGGHGLAYYRYMVNSPTTISTPAFTTQATGSTMIVSVGRGDLSALAPPSDNKGNDPYQQLDASHAYTRYPSSGTALYGFASLAGGPDHVVTAPTTSDDEITLAAVEVVDATHIQAVAWNEVLAAPLTSASVTTTGPATLVAFWWGDADVQNDKTATPNNGFVVVDSILWSGALVQCAVAVKNVPTAGTYDVTWTSTPAQGAQLWLVAVQ